MMSALLIGVIMFGLAQSSVSLTDMQEVVAANNDFAMALYGRIRNNSVGSNIFFSPFSVSSALAMVYAGADGNTKTEMGKVLKLDSVAGSVHAGFNQLFEAFNDPTNNYTLNVANAFFGRNEYPFLESYLDVVTQYYSALVENLDFAGDADGSRQHINDWVANNTNQKIKDLLGDGTIDPLTAAVLVNTIYFNGLWKTKFAIANTTSSAFNTSETSSTKIKMMNLNATMFNYAEVNSMKSKILELPYAGDEVSMYILLPNTTNGLPALESELTAAKLDNAISSMRERKLDVSIPRFEMTLKLDLKKMLVAMGMKDLFGNADLSGIDGTRNLVVSKVVHQAYINVSEEGTEAAAATAVVIRFTSAPIPTTFKADHPFMFFIREKVTGSILFSGRVVNMSPANETSSAPGSVLKATCRHYLSDYVCKILEWLGIEYP